MKKRFGLLMAVFVAGATFSSLRGDEQIETQPSTWQRFKERSVQLGSQVKRGAMRVGGVVGAELERAIRKLVQASVDAALAAFSERLDVLEERLEERIGSAVEAGAERLFPIGEEAAMGASEYEDEELQRAIEASLREAETSSMTEEEQLQEALERSMMEQ